MEPQLRNNKYPEKIDRPSALFAHPSYFFAPILSYRFLEDLRFSGKFKKITFVSYSDEVLIRFYKDKNSIFGSCGFVTGSNNVI